MFRYFLAYMCVHTITGLDQNDANACTRYVTVNLKSRKVKVLSLICCPDYFLKNGTCEPCPAGYFGDECKEKCQPNYYDVQCKQECNCAPDKTCHSIYGCICKNEKNCSERIGISELKSKMLNSTNGWLQATNVSESQEENAIFQHIQLYTIIIAATLLLVVVVAVSVRFHRSVCKRSG